MNNAPLNTRVQVFVERYVFSFSWSESPSYMVTLTFLSACQLFSKMAAPVCNPTSNVWGYQFIHILVDTCYCLFYFSHLVGPKWCLSCFPLVTNDIEDLHLLISHLSVFFGERDFQIRWPYLNWVICLFVVELKKLSSFLKVSFGSLEVKFMSLIIPSRLL